MTGYLILFNLKTDIMVKSAPHSLLALLRRKNCPFYWQSWQGWPLFNSLFLTINDICRYNAVKNIYFKLVSNLQSRIVEKRKKVSIWICLVGWSVGRRRLAAWGRRSGLFGRGVGVSWLFGVWGGGEIVGWLVIPYRKMFTQSRR